jgi:DNA-3-methyladenine glycosylase
VGARLTLPTDPVGAARRLLGGRLTVDAVTVRIVETEAYGGVGEDPGSHAYAGRTPRNATMFGPPGRLYVYFTYGMHHCVNVVVGAEGSASAVLLRAAEVVEGHAVVRDRRGTAVSERDWARGPARLCCALALSRADDGRDLMTDPSLRLDLGPAQPEEVIASGPRVGLRQAADRPWRFWLVGDPHVSPYRAAKVRPAPRPQPPRTGRW